MKKQFAQNAHTHAKRKTILAFRLRLMKVFTIATTADGAGA